VSSLSGQQVQVITWAGATCMGVVTRVTADHLVVVDRGAAWYNRRRHTHTFGLGDIREIVLDRVSPW
jgi:hypothetical protein